MFKIKTDESEEKKDKTLDWFGLLFPIPFIARLRDGSQNLCGFECGMLDPQKLGSRNAYLDFMALLLSASTKNSKHHTVLMSVLLSFPLVSKVTFFFFLFFSSFF